eukprot:COSAG06_NODE_32_length_31260_cov_54.706973_27_plen_195_part_00
MKQRGVFSSYLIPRDRWNAVVPKVDHGRRWRRAGRAGRAGLVRHRLLALAGGLVARTEGHARVALARLEENGTCFEFFLCLSRACLGKKIIYIYIWLKKPVFSPAPWRCRQRGDAHRLQSAEQHALIMEKRRFANWICQDRLWTNRYGKKDTPWRSPPGVSSSSHSPARIARRAPCEKRPHVSIFPMFVPSLSW